MTPNRLRSRLVFGFFIIIVGVVALLDNLDVFDARLVQPYWPMVFVALGLLHIAQRPDARGAVFGIAAIIVGGAMTLNNLHVIHFHWHEWWPLFLIFAGVSVIARAFSPRCARAGVRQFPDRIVDQERMEHGQRIDAAAVMSGIVVRNDSQDFQGGEVSAAMGSVELDLRQASMLSEARLKVSVVMGGVAIKVPRDWSVSINGTPMLGGIEDRTVPPPTVGRRLVIKGSVALGSIEIAN